MVDDAGQAAGSFGAVQPNVRATASDLIGRFGEKAAHGGGQVAHVGQRGGGGEQLGQLNQAGGLVGGAGRLLLAEFGKLQHERGYEAVKNWAWACRFWRCRRSPPPVWAGPAVAVLAPPAG